MMIGASTGTTTRIRSPTTGNHETTTSLSFPVTPTTTTPRREKSHDTAGFSAGDSKSPTALVKRLLLGTHDHSSRRSLADQGRLCLLKSRGKSPHFWSRLVAVIMGLTWTMSNVPHILLDNGRSADYHYNNSMILFQRNVDLPSPQTILQAHRRASLLSSQQPTTKSSPTADYDTWLPSIMREANYGTKPRMMGFVFVPLDEEQPSAGTTTRSSSTSKNVPDYSNAILVQAPIHPTQHVVMDEALVRQQHVPSTRRRGSQPQRPQPEAPTSSSRPRRTDGASDSLQQRPDIKHSNNDDHAKSRRKVRSLGRGRSEQERIRNRSKHYDSEMADPIPDDCQAQYDWQLLSFPTCNLLHEQDLSLKVRQEVPETISGSSGSRRHQAKLVAEGGYRLVWSLDVSSQEQMALKTFRWDEYDWTERNFDRHRRDALLSDRLTASPYALHMFAYCGNSGVYEYANGGSLDDLLYDANAVLKPEWKTWTSAYKMHLAYQVARAVADVHNLDQEGRASMAHSDIAIRQFISVDGGKTFKINDFNRARFLYQSKADPSQNCPFTVGNNVGRFRAPEEYAYEPETERIDVYSMGNIIYILLTGLYPFDEYSRDKMYKAIQEGERPSIGEEYTSSKDPLVAAMVEAIHMCWIHNPVERATSRQVEQVLKQALDKAKDDLSRM